MIGGYRQEKNNNCELSISTEGSTFSNDSLKPVYSIKLQPRWQSKYHIDSDHGQKLLIPDSTNSKVIGKSKLVEGVFCLNQMLVSGPYEVSVNENHRLFQIVTLEFLKNFCILASAFCESAMNRVFFK